MKECVLVIYSDIPETYIIAAIPVDVVDAELTAALTELNGHAINSEDCPEFSQELHELRNDLALDMNNPSSAKCASGKWEKYAGLVHKYRVSATNWQPTVVTNVFRTEFIL